MREIMILSLDKDPTRGTTRVDVIVYADMWTIEVQSIMAQIDAEYCAGTDGTFCNMGRWGE